MKMLEMYTESACLYDDLELNSNQSSILSNELIINYLKKYKVTKIHDISCGTGAQSIALARAGYIVTASDISQEMIDVATRKSKGLSIDFHRADMETVSLGKQDAIISMFNSVGHLSKGKFINTLLNVRSNLNDGGIFIFDIFNRDVMPLLPTYQLIDRAREIDNTFLVRFTKFRFDNVTAKLKVKQHIMLQDGFNEMRKVDRTYELISYKKSELVEMLNRAGFKLEAIRAHGLADFYSDAKNSLVNCLMHFVVCRYVSC